MFDHELRAQLNREQIARLGLDRAAAPPSPALRVVGTLLIRAGERLARPAARRSALAHEALPRC
jgi:hypothetical protein